MEPSVKGRFKICQMFKVCKSRWQPCQYMVKHLKIFFSRTKKAFGLNLGKRHGGLRGYQICSNDDHRLTFDPFTARSDLGPYTFVWGNWGGWVRQKCRISGVTGASNWYWLTVGQSLLFLQQIRIEGEFLCSHIGWCRGHIVFLGFQYVHTNVRPSVQMSLCVYVCTYVRTWSCYTQVKALVPGRILQFYSLVPHSGGICVLWTHF